MKQPAREHERYETTQPVRVRCQIWGQQIPLKTKDISQGGLFIETACPPSLHSSLEIRLGIANGTDVSLRATVVHIVSPDRADAQNEAAGFGVQFTDLGSDQKGAIDNLLKSIRSGAPVSAEPTTPPPRRRSSPKTQSTNVAFGGPVNEPRMLVQLRERLANAKEKNYFVVLDMEPTTDAGAVAASFFELSKRYHPDIFARYSNQEVKQLALDVYLLINQAYKKLSDPIQLERYCRSIGVKTAPSCAPPARKTTAATKSKPRAEKQSASKPARRRVIPAALSSLDADELFAGLNLDPEVGPVPAEVLVSDALHLIARKQYPEATDLLEKALDSDPENTKAKIWINLVEARELQMRGRKEEAVPKYRVVLELDTKNLEAVKGIQEYEKSRGLLSRLFRRRSK